MAIVLNIRPREQYSQRDTNSRGEGCFLPSEEIDRCQQSVASDFPEIHQYYLPKNAVCTQGINVSFTPSSPLNTSGLRKLVIQLNDADSCGAMFGKVALIAFLFISIFGWIALGLWISETIAIHKFQEERDEFINPIREELDRRIAIGRHLYIRPSSPHLTPGEEIREILTQPNYSWLKKQPPEYLQHLADVQPFETDEHGIHV